MAQAKSTPRTPSPADSQHRRLEKEDRFDFAVFGAQFAFMMPISRVRSSIDIIIVLAMPNEATKSECRRASQARNR